jgi:hypothetical protein
MLLPHRAMLMPCHNTCAAKMARIQPTTRNSDAVFLYIISSSQAQRLGHVY